MVYVFLADGFEEMEAIAPVDILRRCGAGVSFVSITGEKAVRGSHGIVINADFLASERNFDDIKAAVLPGGLPGADNLENSKIVQDVLKTASEKGAILAAICAAPKVLGRFGYLKGKKATCYPGFEDMLLGARYVNETVALDGNILTACGAGAAFDFGFKLAEVLGYKKEADKVKTGMLL